MSKLAVAAFLMAAIAAAPVIGQTRPDALVLYRQGQFERAVDVTLQELRENPNNLDSYVVLGWSLLELRRFSDALEYGQQAQRVSRFDHRILHILGEAHYGLGNYTQALQLFQEYAALYPQGRFIAGVYFLMGEVFYRFGEYHHADMAFTKAVHHNPAPALWWNRLGAAREQAGSRRLAVEAYQAALQRNPGLLEARRALERLD